MSEVTFGIDCSSYQNPVDWTAVRASGIGFAILKASEGASHSSSREAYFLHNAAAAKANGLLIGAYHFYRADEDPSTQAAVFRQVLEASGTPMDLPAALDVETTDGASEEWVAEGALECLGVLEGDFERTPLLYSYPDFINFFLPAELFKSFPLWLASYPAVGASFGLPSYSPVLPSGYPTYSVWQYSATGTVPGISSSVDLNLFWGTREELAAIGVPTPWPGYVMEYGGAQNVASDVKRVQKRLSVEQTGVYGMTTACTVMAFQRENGIGQTAQVGEQTWNALFNNG